MSYQLMRLRAIHIGYIYLLSSLLSCVAVADDAVLDKNNRNTKRLINASGREIMEAVYREHQQYPYVYEEQSMVLIDRRGNRETRKLKRYSRVDKDLKTQFLLLFESPDDIKGVAVLAVREKNGDTTQSLFLPAFGDVLIENGSNAVDTTFLGTDFSVEDLTSESLNDYRYERQRDSVLSDVPHYVIDVYKSAPVGASKGDRVRRHLVVKQNLFITQSDQFDELGRLKKRQTHHDLTPVLGNMWRSNMILMDDKFHQHQTLIKIERRVFSADYVPAKFFTKEWLFLNALDEKETEMDDVEESLPIQESTLEVSEL
jgi:hypothetical protein